MSTTLSAKLLSRLRLVASRIRAARARATGAEIGRGVQLGRGCDLDLGFSSRRRGRLVIGNDCEFHQGVVLHPYGGAIHLGSGVFMGSYAVIYGHGGVTIGDRTLVSMHCRILSSNHTIPPAGVDIRSQPDVLLPTRIGRDVWLGAGVTVLGGVTIGDGCVVGAGAVVAHDLPPNSIAFGIPATVRKSRA